MEEPANATTGIGLMVHRCPVNKAGLPLVAVPRHLFQVIARRIFEP